MFKYLVLIIFSFNVFSGSGKKQICSKYLSVEENFVSKDDNSPVVWLTKYTGKSFSFSNEIDVFKQDIYRVGIPFTDKNGNKRQIELEYKKINNVGHANYAVLNNYKIVNSANQEVILNDGKLKRILDSIKGSVDLTGSRKLIKFEIGKGTDLYPVQEISIYNRFKSNHVEEYVNLMRSYFYKPTSYLLTEGKRKLFRTVGALDKKSFRFVSSIITKEKGEVNKLRRHTGSGRIDLKYLAGIENYDDFKTLRRSLERDIVLVKGLDHLLGSKVVLALVAGGLAYLKVPWAKLSEKIKDLLSNENQTERNEEIKKELEDLNSKFIQSIIDDCNERTKKLLKEKMILSEIEKSKEILSEKEKALLESKNEILSSLYNIKEMFLEVESNGLKANVELKQIKDSLFYQIEKIEYELTEEPKK